MCRVVRQQTWLVSTERYTFQTDSFWRPLPGAGRRGCGRKSNLQEINLHGEARLFLPSNVSDQEEIQIDIYML